MLSWLTPLHQHHHHKLAKLLKPNRPAQRTGWTYLEAFLPPLAIALSIFFLSAQSVLPGFELSLYDFLLKKSAHIGIYAALYYSLWRAGSLLSTKPTIHPNRWAIPLLITFLYAISDELHQSLTPGRSPSPRDVGFDMVGATVVFLKLYKYI